jgi:uncharacterized membrane protein YGL010W
MNSRKIDQLLSEYGESHQNPTNKFIHWICVPAIFFSIVGLFWSIPNGLLLGLYAHPFFTWATVALIIVLIYYTTLSISLMVGMGGFSFLCLYFAHLLSQWEFAPLWLISIVIFIAAWIVQFIGHNIEGKKPSFLKDVQFLMIGPAWLMHFIYKKIGLPY